MEKDVGTHLNDSPPIAPAHMQGNDFSWPENYQLTCKGEFFFGLKIVI